MIHRGKHFHSSRPGEVNDMYISIMGYGEDALTEPLYLTHTQSVFLVFDRLCGFVVKID